MWKGLDVLINAMRKENPDLVVMYYNLSPLFLDYFDLFSPDDLFEKCRGVRRGSQPAFLLQQPSGPVGCSHLWLLGI